MALGEVQQLAKVSEKLSMLISTGREPELRVYMQQVFAHLGVNSPALSGRVEQIVRDVLAQVRAANEAEEESDAGPADLIVRVGARAGEKQPADKVLAGAEGEEEEEGEDEEADEDETDEGEDAGEEAVLGPIKNSGPALSSALAAALAPAPADVAQPHEASPHVAPRRRGRPPKVQTASAGVELSTSDTSSKAPKRTRKPMSEERKAFLREQLAKARAVRKERSQRASKESPGAQHEDIDLTSMDDSEPSVTMAFRPEDAYIQTSPRQSAPERRNGSAHQVPPEIVATLHQLPVGGIPAPSASVA
jgi:hypothetical protein